MADNHLAPFILENVKELESGEKKGSGAYGAVYKVTVNGVICIDKRLHDILVNPDVPRRQRESIREKFRAECIILSKLRHPHIVHFVGVRFGQNPGDLSLVTECLHTDLAKFLDEHQEKGVDIPLSIKLSILLDVSYGLLYLHTLTRPIIHRDLSASNILLTADGLQAKIADLGVSKLLDLQTQAKIAQTKVPGSQNYMPPEALTENPEYGLKLDIFSFGHLMLYTATQEFPAVHEVTLTPAILQQGIIQIVKRWKAISRMGGEQHCLHSLVLQCLRDKPELRPTTVKLNENLKELCTQHPRRAAEVLQLSGEADPEKAKLEAVKQWAQQLELGNRQLSEQLNKLSGLNADGNALVNELKAQVRKLEQEKETLQNEVQIAKTEAQLEQVKQKEELEVKNRQLAEQMSEIVKLNAEGNAAINELKAQVRELEEEKEALQNEVQIAKTEAQIYKEDFELERHDREVAHGMIADLQRKYAYDVGKLEEHHKEKLAEVEHVHQGREKEMRGVLEEALKKKKNQQELQAKTSQLKLYKKQVDSQRDQLSELEGRNKELLKERDKLLKERDKLFKELDKTRKDLVQAKTKAEAEKPKKDAKKAKKEAKRKLSIKGATSPDPTGVSKALEERIAKKEQLYEELRDENDTLRAELEECRRANVGLMTHRPESLVLTQSCRILEEDEEIKQEKVKQSLDLQLHKQQQLLQSTEEQTSTLRAGTLSGQAIPKANTPPVQCIHEHPTLADSFHEYPLLAECFCEHPMLAEYFKEHSHASGFAARPPEAHPSIDPALSVQSNNQSPPPPLPPKPSPTLPTPPVEQKEPPKVEYFDKKPPPVEHPPASEFAAQLNVPPGAQPCVGPAVVQQNYIQLPPKPSPIPPTSPVEHIYKQPPPVQEQPPPVKHSFASGFPAQPPGAHPCSGSPLIHQDNNQLPPSPPPKPSLIPPTSPVECIHKPLPPVEHFHEQPPPVEHPPASDFVAQLNVLPGAQPCVGPAVIQQNKNQLPPRPPKPSPTSPTSPSGSEIRQLPPLHAGGLPGTPPFSQQLPQDTHLGAPGILPQAHAYPQTPPVQQWKEPHLLSSQIHPSIMVLPNCLTRNQFLSEVKLNNILEPQSQQANRMQASAKVSSSPQEH